MASPSPWPDWFAAAQRSPIDAAISQIYRALDEDIASRQPTCWLSGKCCHFDSYGHRLYVTGLEVAWLLWQLDTDSRLGLRDIDGLYQLDGCPFQSGKLCGVHATRPLACRIFFCDPSAQGWQQEVYETYQQQIRRLHDNQEIEYQYLEWRVAMDQARAAITH